MKTLRERAELYLKECISASDFSLCDAKTTFFEASERHLQAIWYDPLLRPSHLTLSDGRILTILDSGVWNLESGPDFRDAIFQIDGVQFRGDVEVHVRPSDWDSHGHAIDSAYKNVVLHVTWFDSPKSKTLPENLPLLSLRQLNTFPGFSFEKIKIEKYPFASIPSTMRPCGSHFKDFPERLLPLLQSAGFYRLLQKTTRLEQRLRGLNGNIRQLAYEEWMGAMGYKQNVAPFRQLAQDLPFDFLISIPAEYRFAALAGTAGLIPEKSEMRELWDIWWHLGLERPTHKFDWTFANIRPANHPLKRLKSTALSVAMLDLIILRKPLGKDWADELTDEIAKISELGVARVHALINNVIAPLLLLQNNLSEDLLLFLPEEDDSAPIRETLFRFTGSPTLTKRNGRSGLIQQGLLQIFSDFCRNGRNICSSCPLPLI